MFSHISILIPLTKIQLCSFYKATIQDHETEAAKTTQLSDAGYVAQRL